ncbi:MAG: hypothetical protein ACLQOO_05035 [Terriglobia bacterium]
MLLRDPVCHQRYERAAAELAAQYDWSTIAERFASVLIGAANPSLHSPPHGGRRVMRALESGQ